MQKVQRDIRLNILRKGGRSSTSLSASMSIHSKLQDKNKNLEKQKHLLRGSKVWRRKEVALVQVSKNKVVNEMA